MPWYPFSASDMELVSLICWKDCAGVAAANLDTSLFCDLTSEAGLEFLRHEYFLRFVFIHRW